MDPKNIRNSATKLANPGNPNDAKPAIIKPIATLGI